MRSVAGVVAALAALAVPASAGAYDTGTYKGTLDQAGGVPLKFKVVSKHVRSHGKRVVKRYVRLHGQFTKVAVTCPDDFVYNVNLNLKTETTDIPIKGRRFSFAKQLEFSGKLAGEGTNSHASGTLTFGFEGVDEHGGDCTSGKLSWSAQR
jgi:hypothetical protein